MTIPRRFIIFILLLITSQPLHLFAAERLEVKILSTILNIRDAQSTHSPVVGVLHKGDRVTAITTDMRDWLKLDDDRGFISINYTTVLSRTPVLLAPPEETELQALLPVEETITQSTPLTKETQQVCSKTPLPIESSSKICRKNLNTLGYESCQLLLQLTLTDSCHSSNQIKIVCTASALATDSQSKQSRYELTNTRVISSSDDATTVLLEWFPDTKALAIQRIEVHDGQCEMTL